jgi:hypothetical protein
MPFKSENTGVDQTTNLVKMIGVLVVPFLAIFVAVQIFTPLEWIYLADVFCIVGWMMYITMLFTSAKSKSTSYLPFPQSHWRFPDGQQINYDLEVLPSDEHGHECIKVYDDGAELHRVNFKTPICYKDKDRPFPDVFSYALWKIPAEWSKAFDRNGHGEFFAGTLFVDHPACENITVEVVGWDERATHRIPICIITGCSYTYKQTLAESGLTFPKVPTMPQSQINDAVLTDLKNENAELWTRNDFLEDENERLNKTTPTNIQELSDKRMSNVVTRHKGIMNIPKESKFKILNLKTLAIVLIMALVVFVVTHFVWGWP